MSIIRRICPVLALFLPIVTNAHPEHWLVQAGAYAYQKTALQQQRAVQTVLRDQRVMVFNIDQQDKVLYTIRIPHLSSQAIAEQLVATLRENNIDAYALHEDDHVTLYKWTSNAAEEQTRVAQSQQELERAYEQPEVVLKKTIHMPIAPDAATKKTYAMSLHDAILLLLRYNPVVQGRELDRIVDRYNLRVAQNEFEFQYALTGSYAYTHTTSQGVHLPDSSSGALLPTVSLKNGIGTEMSVGLNTNTDFNSVNPQAVFSLTQPLLRGFGSDVTQVPLKNSYDTEVIQQLGLKNGIISDVVGVIRAYRSYISANNRVLIQKQSLEDAIHTYQNNEAKIRAGQLEAAANIQQNAQVEQLRLSLTSAQNNSEQLKQSLLQAIGLDPTMNIHVPDDVDIGKPTVPDPTTTIEYALKHSAVYQQALLQFRITQRGLITAEDNLRWQLNATAQATYGATSGTGGDAGLGSLVNGRNHSEGVGLSLTVPINDLPSRQAAINAKLAVEKARVNLAATRRALITDVKNQTRNIKNQLDQVGIANRSMELAQQSYELEKKKRLAGISSSLDVTNSQNLLINARVSLIDAKIGYLNALTDLSATVGTTLDDWKIELRY